MKIGRRGTVVIPARLRKQLGLDEGDLMVAEAVDEGILLRRAAVVPDERAWAEAFLREVNEAYARLREDPQAWAAELEERKQLEGTLMDGLDPDEQWGPDGRPI